MSALSDLVGAVVGSVVGLPVGVILSLILALRMLSADAGAVERSLLRTYLPALVGVGPLGAAVLELASATSVAPATFLLGYFFAVGIVVVPTGLMFLSRTIKKRTVRQRLSKLAPIDRAILKHVFQVRKPKSIAEVAAEYGVREPYVRRLIHRFLAEYKNRQRPR